MHITSLLMYHLCIAAVQSQSGGISIAKFKFLWLLGEFNIIQCACQSYDHDVSICSLISMPIPSFLMLKLKSFEWAFSMYELIKVTRHTFVQQF